MESRATTRFIGARVRVLEARRDSTPEIIALDAFMARCDEYFRNDGGVIDQPFQARLPEGMIRVCMGTNEVVGFGHQLIKALIDPPPEARIRPLLSLAHASCTRNRHLNFSARES